MDFPHSEDGLNTPETLPLIAAAITAHWGERCEGEQEPGCPICDAWAEFDSIAPPADDARGMGAA